MEIRFFQALDNVNLEINNGEFVAITGKSGSGKSTLMNVLGLLDDYDSGKYELAGTEINAMSEDAAAAIRNEKIGFVFQLFNLLPMLNVLENVMLPVTFKQYDKAAAKAQAEELIAKFGLESKIKHKPGQLSGGQIQRVAIARSLITKPSILLADEPTGNLDAKIAAEIIEHFKQLNKEGQTVVLVTHDPGIAMQADRIVTIESGKITSDIRK